ncbi:MAG: glycosyltransferase, Cap1E-like family [Firmicutes bacterium]|nr:glycosyltransferase, Cap1E-like family [Bacillota bacterium]
MAKIMIIAGYGKSLIGFRGDMIQEMVRQGHEVIGMAPEEGFEPAMQKLGAKYQRIPLARHGMNPLQDLRTLGFLVKKMREIKPDVVITYAAKPIIYGNLAARLAKVENTYTMITGIAYAFIGENWKQKLIALFLTHSYQNVMKYNKGLIFQNKDDLKLFQNLKIVRNGQKTTIVNGSGVDIDKYVSAVDPPQPLSFLLIGRLVWAKGIGEFVEAARLLKKRYPQVRFRILGPLDEGNHNAITQEYIRKWQEEQLIEYLGKTEDVRPYLEAASVCVLPSYREGTPRSVLEAMSMGRPVITTDAPGCRETVNDGVNGYLVPVRDINKLAAAMEKFILDPDLISVMGKKSRQMAVDKYDVHKVTHSILQAMELV